MGTLGEEGLKRLDGVKRGVNITSQRLKRVYFVQTVQRLA